MNTELSRDIDKFIAENEEEIFRNIARLVAINSVETEAKPGAPFGEGPARALKEALAMARELGLEFSIRELQDYETEHYARRHRDVELTEEDLAAPDEEPEYWLIQHGWSHDDSIFCPGSKKEPGLIRIEKRK